MKQLLIKIEKIIFGVDIARGGGDFSWIIDRQGSFLGFNVNEKVNRGIGGIVLGNIGSVLRENWDEQKPNK